MTAQTEAIPSSFRDPSGFVFRHDGRLYRQVNTSYREHYDRLMASGLYQSLVSDRMLIAHTEAHPKVARNGDAYVFLEPQVVSFISYPYEWCFSQLKEAALLTLDVQSRAIEYEMTLKDSSAYNVQFVDGHPMLLDTLSFAIYEQGQPWVAYRQFCQHFLAPLALMSYRDVRLSQLLRVHLDGIPLDLASSLLPMRTRLRPSLLMHIHLHAKSQRHFADKTVNTRGRKVSRIGLLGLIDSLRSAVKKLHWRPAGTEWADYYGGTNYTDAAMLGKQATVAEYLDTLKRGMVWDLGANTGVFSRIAAERGARVTAFDIDPAAVEKNHLEFCKQGDVCVLPLVLDLTNPSPATGWANRERMSLLERGPADTVLALALIHHLAISNNLPLHMIAGFLSELCDTLIIEFVPKSDSQVQRLLATREDVFPNYTQEAFEHAFARHFTLMRSERVADSERTLYLMRKEPLRD